MPKRIQVHRVKGWRLPPGTVKVDRSSKWGNPYQVVHDPTWGWLVVRGNLRYWPHFKCRDAAAALAVRWYATRYLGKRLRAAARRDLRGKDLACWCRAGRSCHADVLLEVANA